MTDALMDTYRRLPVAFERGVGAWLWDTRGKKYLDAVSGIGVCGLGHAHPRLAEALCEQAQVLVHTSNLYRIPLQEKLAEMLVRLSGLEKAFFCNSGAEANEAAIKIARLYGHGKGIEVPTIAVAEGSFHGRTLATLSATGNRRVQAGFEPLVKGFARVPFDDLEALRAVAENDPDVVAVLLEPIQGEGGVVVPGEGYLEGVREICDEQGWLLMLDEVQTGMGRTGCWFAFQHEGILPDVVTLAKGLGNGFPIGACLARGEAAKAFTPGSHGSTFGGNPLACRAALAVIEIMEAGNLVDRAAWLGKRLKEALASLLDLSGVRDVRGRGLMVGIELEHPPQGIMERGLEKGLLVNVTAERVVRLLPPLILSDEELAFLAERVIELVREALP